jgi:hypothetical protein
LLKVLLKYFRFVLIVYKLAGATCYLKNHAT